MISPKLVEVGRHTNIDLLTYSELVELKGEPGNFTAVVHKKARYVDLAKCTSCGECTKVCPIETVNDYDEGLSQRKAIFKQYAQAMPGAYAINKRGTAPCVDYITPEDYAARRPARRPVRRMSASRVTLR